MDTASARQKVSVVQALMVPGGGTEAVTAWAVQALCDDYDVSLVSYSDVDAGILDRYYGTSLSKEKISFIQPKLPRWLSRTNRFVYLKEHLMMRYCKAKRANCDLYVGVGGVMDVGSKAIQYVALAPGSVLAKVVGGDPSMPVLYRFSKRVLMSLNHRVSGYTNDGMRRNVTMVTSSWAGELVRRLFSVTNYRVAYPPVNVPDAISAWDGRTNGFLCVARVSPEKQIEQAIEILHRVRARGHNLDLRIVGRQDNPEYLAELQKLRDSDAVGGESWIKFDGLLPREELKSLMDSYRYGINAAEDEPFGIALAEMVTSGCIVFVPDSGGQIEIVKNENLIFTNITNAVEKICEVMESSELQRSTLEGLADGKDQFSTAAFCNNIRQMVGELFLEVQENQRLEQI